MKILIISFETWCDTTNGGNVLSNIFDAFTDARFAQIYCSPGTPQNQLCTDYFQISDTMLLKGGGRGFTTEPSGDDAVPKEEEWLSEHTRRTPLRNLFMLGRELLWKLLPWKTRALADFITGFAPDVIFAPCYYHAHMSRIALYAHELTGSPIISYISDDNYSLRKISFSPSFWLNKLMTRRAIRALFSECELIYTMTSAQKREYEAIFHKPMKLLCKSADFDRVTLNERHRPIRLIYGGALYLNRWKLLREIKNALAQLNEGELHAQLAIFTGSKLNGRMRKALADGRNAAVYPAVSYSRLTEEYRSSDIAIHVESFDKRSFLMTRLSFSTKIIDCMKSGCAVLAIGPRGQAGIDYLEENDAAVCVRDRSGIAPAVARFVSDPALIGEYAQKAIDLGKRKHQRAAVGISVKQDFETIVKGQKQNIC